MREGGKYRQGLPSPWLKGSRMMRDAYRLKLTPTVITFIRHLPIGRQPYQSRSSMRPFAFILYCLVSSGEITIGKVICLLARSGEVNRRAIATSTRLATPLLVGHDLQ